MKTIYGLPIYSILLFAIWSLECSSLKTNSLNEGLHVSSPTPTPNNSSTENIYKVEGCEIPLPPRKRQREKGFATRDSETGYPVRVANTLYESPVDFFFTRSSFFVPEEERQVPEQLNKLVWLEEMKVKDKIFGYNIFSQSAALQENTGHPILDAHKNIYTCYDFDGDGRFEYVINYSDKVLLVPRWASE